MSIYRKTIIALAFIVVILGIYFYVYNERLHQQQDATMTEEVRQEQQGQTAFELKKAQFKQEIQYEIDLLEEEINKLNAEISPSESKAYQELSEIQQRKKAMETELKLLDSLTEGKWENYKKGVKTSFEAMESDIDSLKKIM